MTYLFQIIFTLGLLTSLFILFEILHFSKKTICRFIKKLLRNEKYK
ncbi:hypothetical protein LV84_03463 [Algoriphagus ratkowskyi]|uniref:Uncharacterized protein n=1 Tax=Algoriphagus ratkowskyi TaxID=57028 RepID=A0A2W7R9U5_9BACT|nr:hypothetical protein LV84_03463 [Algoriphagus ratkowskyi]